MATEAPATPIAATRLFMENRSAIRLPGAKRKSGPFNGGDYRTVAAWSQPVRAVPEPSVYTTICKPKESQ